MAKRLDDLVDRVAEAAIRAAAGLPIRLDNLPEGLRAIAEETARRIALRIADDRGGAIRCTLCGKAPFTRKGFYLHARRVHIDIVREMARRELEQLLWRRAAETRV